MAFKKSELQNMKRFLLRKMARTLGYDMQEVTKLTQDQLVDWLLENQEEGGKDEKKKKKEDEPKRGRGVPARGKSTEKEKEDEEKFEKVEQERPRGRAESRESGGGDLEKLFRTFEKKVDTIGAVQDAIGAVQDALAKSVTDSINELRADLYVLTGGFKYLAARMEVEDVVTEESQEDGRTVEDEMKRIEDETQGS
jgi:hypothetical protein